MAVTLDDPDAYFDRLDAFDLSHWWPATMRRVALGCLERVLSGRTGLSLLDVGCGTGRMLRSLASLSAIGAVYGVEPERAALDRGDPERSLVQGSAERLPFRDRSIDVVTCFDVLQHLPPQGDQVALREMARVLGRDGVLFIRANAGGKTGYRLGALRKKVEGSGFRVIRSSYLNMLPALGSEIRSRLRGVSGHPEGRGLPSPSPRGSGSRLIEWVALCEERALLRLGIDLPWGHSTLIVAQKTGG